MQPITRDTLDIIDSALEEDLAYQDPTTACLIPPDQRGRAVLLAKSPGVLAGVGVACAVFQRVDPTVEASILREDGTRLKAGDHVAVVRGSVRGILKAERTALNFIQRMSGIATLTSQYVQAVQGLPVHILDTRKTAPGLRLLDKYAVRMGGGRNHRMNLADGILIKDNHIAALAAQGVSLRETVRRAVEQAPHTLKVEVEVETLQQAEEALEGGAHILLLDNMGLEEMALAAAMARGRALTEASGGITLEKVRAVAETGVDMISVGALTHSVQAMDISLDFQV
ncbi:MAG: carboxylating nicotinate-nucleotide diphosphorylase [Chloroflexi bacterium]|nr:carboxylating nicotinate-nucleotide diphosphorylase [Chloroflexota bacterium]